MLIFSEALMVVEFFLQFSDFSLNKSCKNISGNRAATRNLKLAADFPSTNKFSRPKIRRLWSTKTLSRPNGQNIESTKSDSSKRHETLNIAKNLWKCSGIYSKKVFIGFSQFVTFSWSARRLSRS
jgi:hypothetical protein